MRDTRTEPPRRHVWINLSNIARAPAEHPGVILAWRQRETGWEAQVAYVTEHEGLTTLHLIWCESARLRPV